MIDKTVIFELEFLFIINEMNITGFGIQEAKIK